MTSTRLGAVALALALAGHAIAHAPTPASMLGVLNASEARTALGVERAERDRTNPRVLVVRVSPRWFDLEGADRLLQARCWRRPARDRARRVSSPGAGAGTGQAAVLYDAGWRGPRW